MTKTSKRSRITAIVLTLAMALGIFGTMGVASASAATDNISLYSSGATFQKYGRTSYEIFIKTRGTASSQNVYVHYNYLDGESWMDAKATYVTKLSDGSNIWKATLGSYNLQYALKLVANGKETWDNNNGKNYTADDIFGLLGCTEDPNYPGSKDEHDFISIRGEIEAFMFAGFSFVDAIKEWD